MGGPREKQAEKTWRSPKKNSVQTVLSPELGEDLAYQDHILQGVSRTFALTIPQLPSDLQVVVGNAYLLCRIADTIEDSAALDVNAKKQYSEQFVRVVTGQDSPEAFAYGLAPLLDDSTIDAEKELIRNTPRVIRLTHAFSMEDQQALSRCVRIMSEGMETFQEGRFHHGLADQRQMDSYCYYVAGVVGEMLTELFCAHSTAIARNRHTLEHLAASFGQGLQMTNILKDIWDDKQRDVCWLPQSAFEREGFDLRALAQGQQNAAFEKGLAQLIGVAHGHLRNALRYTLLIPRSEQGIRKFCLWAIAMAVLTLRNINHKRGFASGQEVKISRRSVRAVIMLTSLVGRSNVLLRGMFALAAMGLPTPSPEDKHSSA